MCRSRTARGTEPGKGGAAIPAARRDAEAVAVAAEPGRCATWIAARFAREPAILATAVQFVGLDHKLWVLRVAMSSEGSGGRTVEPVIKEDFGCAA
ncbi:hypothetical protein GCM10010345_66170 [Streptomyces canarius]|uniref:Uncharacterized protein n=1 Tax=Streptomyces canarius TaxID=285453 RepID=A0ABQ3D0A0_9ACTN|nr:hypothetical protein GCM10010345_66170 [Streptomyces canarius]